MMHVSIRLLLCPGRLFPATVVNYSWQRKADLLCTTKQPLRSPGICDDNQHPQLVFMPHISPVLTDELKDRGVESTDSDQDFRSTPGDK